MHEPFFFFFFLFWDAKKKMYGVMGYGVRLTEIIWWSGSSVATIVLVLVTSGGWRDC